MQRQVGNIPTSGNGQSGNATVNGLDSNDVINAREGIYIYPGKYLTANGPINGFNGLTVIGPTSLQTTITTGVITSSLGLTFNNIT